MLLKHTIVGQFDIGLVLVTPQAQKIITEDERISALTRHANADWGDVTPDDKVANDLALQHGGDYILSAYHTESGTRFWIKTEYDRSVTTILLPEEG